MNMKSICKAVQIIEKSLKKHSPEILTGIGITGMIVTTIAAVRATPKAMQLVDEREINENKRLTNSEIVKTTWKCYIPAAITGVCSVACLIGATSVNSRRNAALATAYSISETALKDYQDKTVKIVGDKKEQAIRDAVAKEKLEQADIQNREFIITGKGETHCFDPLTNSCFKSDIETLRRAENTLNKQLRNELHITVNEFLQEIGLSPCDESIGERMGWDVDKGDIEFDYSSQLLNGVPYLVLGHYNPPQYIGW